MFQTKSREVIVTMIGRSCGSVMLQKRRKDEAPSMWPASYSSLGTFCSPASSTTVVCGMPVQMPTTITAGSAMEKSLSQSMLWSSRPTSRSTLLRIPAFGW